MFAIAGWQVDGGQQAIVQRDRNEVVVLLLHLRQQAGGVALQDALHAPFGRATAPPLTGDPHQNPVTVPGVVELVVSDIDVLAAVLTQGKTEALAAAAQPGLDQIALVSPQQSLILVTLKNLETDKGVKGRLQTLFIRLVGELEGLGQSRLIHRCGGVELIDQIGTAAGDENDVSAPGLVFRLEGKNLPIAGDDYFPEPQRITESKQTTKIQSLDNYRDPYGYRMKADGGQQIALTTLEKPITTGRATITWKMKPANSAPTRNGFLVLSNDPKGKASVLAGSWMGSNNITIFENTSENWSGSDRKCNTEGELDCRAVLDMDDRSVTLTICLLYTSPSPRDVEESRMPSSA